MTLLTGGWQTSRQTRIGRRPLARCSGRCACTGVVPKILRGYMGHHGCVVEHGDLWSYSKRGGRHPSWRRYIRRRGGYHRFIAAVCLVHAALTRYKCQEQRQLHREMLQGSVILVSGGQEEAAMAHSGGGRCAGQSIGARVSEKARRMPD